MRIKLSTEEKHEERLSPENLRIAVRFLREIGAVVLESAVSLDLLGQIRQAYAELTRDGRKFKSGAPMALPFCDPGIIANPYVMQILEAIFGTKIGLALYFIHKVDPGSDEEGGAHRDGNHLFPELQCTLPASGIYMDVPLADFTLENGATRIWPGSHLILDVPQSDVRNLGERGQHLPSVQMAMPVGSLFLRDMRLWHGAMPNLTDQVRLMLDVCYVRVFPHAHERLPLPEDVKQRLPASARRVLRTA